MFTKIGEERAFDAILGQIIENIQADIYEPQKFIRF